MESPSLKPSGALGRRIVRGMITIVFFGLFLKLGGFLINLFMLRYYGEGPVYDVFTAVYSNIVVLFFFSSTLKVVLPAFMPLFAERMHAEGEAEAWQFANTVLNLLLIVISAVVGASLIWSAQIVNTLLPGFTPEARADAARLLRWMAPGLIVVLGAVKVQGILNSYKVFSYPSAGEATLKMVWVATLVAAAGILGFTRDPDLAPRLIGAAFLAGCAGQAVVLLAGLRTKAHLYRAALPSTTLSRLGKECLWSGGVMVGWGIWLKLLAVCGDQPETSWYHIGANDRKFFSLTGLLALACAYAVGLYYRGRRGKSIMARFAALAAPLLIGVLFARYRDLSSTFFQSYTAEGDFGIIEFAKKVTNLPIVLVAYSLSIAMFPYLCDLATERDKTALARVVGRTLRMIAFFFLPLTVLTIVLAGPVMQLLGDRGDWSPEKIHSARMALGLLSIGILFMSIENVLMQTFFSLQRTVLPTVLGMVFSVTYGLGLYVAIERLGWDSPSQAFLVVCVAYPLPRLLKNCCLFGVLQRQLGLVPLRDAATFLGKLLVICVAVGAVAWGGYAPLSRAVPLPSAGGGRVAFELTKCLHVAAPALAALATFVALAALLRAEEFLAVVEWVRRRGWKKVSSSTAPDDA